MKKLLSFNSWQEQRDFYTALAREEAEAEEAKAKKSS